MALPLVVAAVYACTGSDPESAIVVHDGLDASPSGSSGSSGGSSSGTSGGDPPPVYTGPKFCDSQDGGAICEDFDHGPASEHGWTFEDQGGGTVDLVSDGGAMSAQVTIPAREHETDVRARFTRFVTADAGARSWAMDADIRLVSQSESLAGALVFHFDDQSGGDVATFSFDKTPATAYGYVDPSGAGASFPFTAGTWHHVQLRLAVADGGTTSAFVLRVDGADRASSDHLAVPSTQTAVDFGLSGYQPGGAVTIEIDNLVYRVE